MSNLDPLDTYAKFISLKLHFTSPNYNFFTYQGKTKVSKESFLSRKDQFQFIKLSRICNEDTIIDYLVANFIENKQWIGDFVHAEGMDNYYKYLKVKESLSYIFETELDGLFETHIKLSEIFKSPKNSYCEFLYKYMNKTISPQTMTLIINFLNLKNKFDNDYGTDDLMWSKIKNISTKLYPFILDGYHNSARRNVFKNIFIIKIKEHFNEGHETSLS